VTWLVLGAALLVGAILVMRWFVGADPKTILRVLKWVGLALAIMFGVLMLVSGRLAWLWVALVGLMPWVSRLRMLGRLAKAARGPSGGQQSEVRTRFVLMRLDHDTGDMDGEVLQGPFAGRNLSELTRDDVVSLWRDAASDPQSVSVLEAYLDRVHGDAWDRGGARPRGSGGQDKRPGQGGAMTMEEAYNILGLDTDATEAEIKRSHKELMKKVHPDHGGSDYLASKINEAKELLLKFT
jgi:hypothetical protein